MTLPIGKEADYVHIGLVSSQVHLMLKNKKTHPRPSLLHFVPFFMGLVLLVKSLSLPFSPSVSPPPISSIGYQFLYFGLLWIQLTVT